MTRHHAKLCAQFCAACLMSSAAAANLDGLAKRSWIKVDSPNFSIVTEQPEEVARQVVSDLEAFRYFKLTLGGTRTLNTSKPLPMLAVGDEAFAELGFPRYWAGVFQLGLNGYSAIANIGDYLHDKHSRNRARTNLLHEYSHFLLRLQEQTYAYPNWVEEGVSDYWATFQVDGRTIRIGNYLSANRTSGLYNQFGRLTIDTETTFNATNLPLESKEIDAESELHRFYSRAFFAVHYFNSSDALRASLDTYIKLINRGYRQDRAAMLAFHKSYEELDNDIRKYVTRRMAAHVLTAKQGNFDFPTFSPTVTRLDVPGLYRQLAHILSDFNTLRQHQRQLLTRNRELNPADADANILPLLLDVDGSAAAAADLERRFPKHAKLMAWRAEQLRRQAEYMSDRGDAGWLSIAYQARGYYREAISIDPDYPAPYNGLGLLYRLLPASEPLREAVVGLDTASIYTRSPATFRELANVYLRMGKPLDARGALRSAVAFSMPAALGPEVLLLDNIEILNDLAGEAQATASGLDYASGTRYTGAVSNGKPEGVGKISLPDGSYYEGPFVLGLPHGKGKLASDAGLIYQGEFDQGYGRGQGAISYPAGSQAIFYQGQVDYLRPSGSGELVTKAGRYVGAFEEGHMHGAGEFTAAQQPVKLSGTWRRGGIEWPAAGGIIFYGAPNANGQRHGHGRCRRTDTEDIPVPCEFKDGKIVER